MTKNRKTSRRIARNPKSGTERPISRIVAFKASAILKQRINRHSPGGVA
jgi:integration host factor subunit alpha